MESNKIPKRKKISFTEGKIDITTKLGQSSDDVELKKTYSTKNVGVVGVDFSGEVGKQFTRVELLEQYYRLCEIVRACIDAIAYASVQSGYHFEPCNPNEEIDKNILTLLNRFFDNVNEDDDFSDLGLDTFFDLLTFGDAYWEKVVKYKQLMDFLEYLKNPKGDPWEVEIPYSLYKVSAMYMHAHWNDKKRIVDKYEQRDIAGKVITEWEPHQIVHFRMSSPIDEISGFAPATTLKNIIAADIYSNNYNAKFFENNATPRLHIDLGKVSKAELDAFCGEVEQNLKGKPHKNIVTRGGVTIHPIGLTNNDMQFSEYQKHLTQKVLATFRVPPIILGMTELTKGITADAQIALFKFLAVDPIRRIVASRINKKIINTLFPGVRVKFVFNPIDRLDQAMQSQVDKSDLSGNIKTVNEVRAARGMGKVSWGDQPVPMPGQKIPGANERRTNEEGEEGGDENGYQ